jgi:peptide chain release factor 1
MNIDKSELRIEYMRGTGKGGQKKNKTDSACRITHLPTGITAFCQDERNRLANYKQALKTIEQRLKAHKDGAKAKKKKERRDRAIQDHTTVRTYDFSRGVVTDHRTGKSASIKDILYKGKLDKLK